MCNDWKFFEEKLVELSKKNRVSFNEKLKKIQTSRIHPDLISDIKVLAYGEYCELKSICNIQVSDARTFSIRAYDPSIIEDISKGIRKQRPDFNPIVSSDTITISLPQVTEETRKKTVKEVKNFLEESKISLRLIRKDIMNEIKNKKLSEDLEKQYINDLDKLIKDENIFLDKDAASKEKDLMSI